MAQEIGALVISLRTESAAFQAEMERARRSVQRTGQQASDSSRQIAKLAADGFGAVLPISFQVENALERFIEKSFKAQGAMALLGKATLVVGAGLAAFKLGEMIGEFAALGTSVEQYEKDIKAATEEQKKFADAMTRQRDVMRSLDVELAKLRGDQGRALELEFQGRAADIVKQFGGASPAAKAALEKLAQLRVLTEEKALADQRKLRDENDQKLLEQITKERDEQVKKWREETAALADQLKVRLKLRQDFEAQLGQGGLPGTGLSQGFAAVRDFRKQIGKDAGDLAGLERLGQLTPRDSLTERENLRTRALAQAEELRRQFAAFPAILEQIDQAVASIEFGNFGREMAVAAAEARKLLDTDAQLAQQLGAISSKLIETLPATDAATQATREMSAVYLDAANAVYQLRVQLGALVGEQAAAGVR